VTEVPNLTAVEDITALVIAFRARDTVPVFSPESGDETWIYAADNESDRLSPLKAIVPTPVFKAWQGQINGN
jgi:hypothetical protein